MPLRLFYHRHPHLTLYLMLCSCYICQCLERMPVWKFRRSWVANEVVFLPLWLKGEKRKCKKVIVPKLSSWGFFLNQQPCSYAVQNVKVVQTIIRNFCIKNEFFKMTMSLCSRHWVVWHQTPISNDLGRRTTNSTILLFYSKSHTIYLLRM